MVLTHLRSRSNLALFPMTLAALLVAGPSPGEETTTSTGGRVRLSRHDYDRLKDAADAADAEPERKASRGPRSTLEAATFRLALEGEREEVELTAEVSVRGPELTRTSPPAWTARLPLAISGALVSLSDRGPAPVAAARDEKVAGRLSLVFTRAGTYQVTARFLPDVRTRDAERRFELDVPPAAATRVVLASSRAKDSILLASGGSAPAELSRGVPRGVAAGSVATIVIRPPAGVAPKAEHPVVRAETVDVVRVELERIVTRVLIHLDVTRAPLAALPFQAPLGSRVVEVSGPGDPSADLDPKTGRGQLRPSDPILGEARFSLLLQRPAPDGDSRLEVPPIRLESAAGARGFLLVQASPLREQALDSTERLVRIDVSDLPAVARPFSEGGVRAYRAEGPCVSPAGQAIAVQPDCPGARLVMRAPRRRVARLAETLVHETSVLTALGGNGSRVDSRRYVLETEQPYVSLPRYPDEEILSVTVDGAPARPLEGGDVLVVGTATAGRHTVEVTVQRKAEHLPKRGDLTIAHPPLAGSPSLASWTVVLPDDRRYRYVSSVGLDHTGWDADERPQDLAEKPAAIPWASSGEGGGGSLDVMVTDESKRGLPGATVVVADPTGAIRTGVANDEGRVTFRALPPHGYTVTATLSGFTKVERRASVSSSAGVSLSMPLRLNAVTETIVVTAEEPATDMKKSETSQTFQTSPPPPVSPSRPGNENRFEIDGVDQWNRSSYEAGIRSLPVKVTGHGKRLLMKGPLVTGPLSVTLKVRS